MAEPSSASAPEQELIRKSAVEIQQEYYEAIGDADWELFSKNERKYLLQKVAIALCGPPTKEGNLLDGNDLKLQGYELRDEETSYKIFNKICEQAKYTHNGENILISILRVVCVIPKEEVPLLKPTPADYWVDLHTKNSGVNFYIFHVFCVRKCITLKADAKGCRIYIDHDARVYKTWDDYLTKNNLPKCVMVVPENGEYKGDFEQIVSKIDTMKGIMPSVKLTIVPSPALGIGARVLSIADTASTVANIGALAGVAVALAAPVAAPVALGAALGVGVATGIYGIVRSSINLADRSEHEQSISLADSEARGSWINIMVSTAGISCGAATKLLSWAAASGTNVKILMNAVQVLQYTNLGSGAIGVVNSLYDMVYKIFRLGINKRGHINAKRRRPHRFITVRGLSYARYNETPTTVEIFQFTASALFLGIGVMSNQTAQEIVQDAQARTINEVRESLPSNVKKKMFDKVTAETRRVKGTVNGNADVIKALNKIENKEDFFAKLARVNKQANKNKIRISLSPDGNPLFNNQYKVGVDQLQTLGKVGREQLFAKYGPATVTTRNVPTRIYASDTSATNSNISTKEIVCYITSSEVIKITNFLIKLSRADQDFIAEILSLLSSDLHDAFLLLCAELISSLIPGEIELLLSVDRDYKIRVVLYVFNYIKSKIDINDSDNDISFGNILKEFIKNGRIDKNTLIRLKERLLSKVRERKAMGHDDLHKDDDITKFRKTYFNKGFIALEAGEILNIGQHSFLVKADTVMFLEEWLETFSQVQCDMFMNLSFNIIAALSTKEFNYIIEFNYDEDIIMRVSYFLLAVVESVFDFLTVDMVDTEMFSDIAVNLKEELIRWRSIQNLRKHSNCTSCSGIHYIN